MLFLILTFLSALSLATVAGWFSIVGFMAIYAGAPFYALIMGVVTECAKLVTISWLYRNWDFANWKLKLPLIYFTLALMLATSIGVFGFLSKAHIEQGAGTLNNSSKIETLQYQIDREKSIIADNEKIINQLDSIVNSFLEKDRLDKSLAVRKNQAKQRKQLRDDITTSQKTIDTLNAEKFKLESEIRSLQLEVGPIRYIAELIYGVEDNSTKNIESAVKIFTLLLVSTLDPLAVILLIAANHSLLRVRSGKIDKPPADNNKDITNNPIIPVSVNTEKEEKSTSLSEDTNNNIQDIIADITQDIIAEKLQAADTEVLDNKDAPQTNTTNLINDTITEDTVDNTLPEKQVDKKVSDITHEGKTPWAQQSSVLREIIGNIPHFIPKKIIEVPDVNADNSKLNNLENKYPTTLSWLKEFRRYDRD